MMRSIEIGQSSPEFVAIMRLAELGGQGSVLQIMPAMWASFQSTTRFHNRVGVRLIESGMAVSLAGGDYSLTNAGRAFARQHGHATPAAGPLFAGSGSKVAALMQQAGTLRPGALEYRQHPSLMGGKQVAYHAVRDAEDEANG